MQKSKLIIAALILASTQASAADLTFKNTSLRSIPLEIPGVMNPNLNPMSDSGVTLDKGQKIYFKYKGQRTLLLEITNQKDGDIIVINDVIAARRAELDKR
jgi:hypothetical protein